MSSFPPPPPPPDQPQGPPPYGQAPYGQAPYGQAPPPSFQPPAAPYQYGGVLPSGAPLASPGKRIGGWLIDWVIMIAVLAVVWVIAVVIMGATTTTTVDEFGFSDDELSGLGAVVMIAAYGLTLLVPIVYTIVFVAVRGQTPGAMLVKVKVVRLADGQTPGWGPAVMRWLPNLAGIACSLISLGLYIWGLVNLYSNELRQTPFDLAAKTVVIDVS